jgi:hypothetical protein
MRAVVVMVAAAALLVAGAVAFAGVAATPEVDRANATMQLKGKFASVQCVGEDGGGYTTLRGKWKGPENDVTPGSTDYLLTGNLLVAKVVWTINLATQRGVIRSGITLTDPGANRVYSGNVTIITQGLPQPGSIVNGRGWIDAKTYDPPGVGDGGSLLANLEVQINGGTLALNGEFGDAPPNFGFPDWSSTTINRNCP